MAEKIQVLNPEEVIALVYEELTNGPIKRRVGDKTIATFAEISTLLDEFTDYHRTDSCWFKGRGVVIAPRTVVVIGEADYSYLAKIKQGLAVGFIKGDEISPQACSHAIWPCALGLFVNEKTGLLEYHLGKVEGSHEIKTEPADENWRIAEYFKDVAQSPGGGQIRLEEKMPATEIVLKGYIPVAKKGTKYQEEVVWECLARLLRIIELNGPAKK
jgi:hypothetical protein